MTAPTPSAAVPPGPGVRPPFAAPPVDRDHKRLWIGLGIGAVLLVLCCVGGLFGLGALGVAGQNQLRQQVSRTVDDYLTALRDQEWGTAYDLTCARLRDAQTLDEFARSRAGQPRFVSWTSGDTEFASDGYRQPVQIEDENGATQDLTFRVVEEGAGSDLKVCGTEQ